MMSKMFQLLVIFFFKVVIGKSFDIIGVTWFKVKREFFLFDSYHRRIFLFTFQKHKTSTIGFLFNGQVIEIIWYSDKCIISFCSIHAFIRLLKVFFTSNNWKIFEWMLCRQSWLKYCCFSNEIITVFKCRNLGQKQ